ncbi:614/534 cytochrome P450 [Russula earlei]|uniref:614/534 cytochrome P450 n=1 Tax=Russula earlei TaxID=71964 RepID=A0ACC0UDY9_9AGAM|nr:614/534 cytochrome P450 [Russula earlei]
MTFKDALHTLSTQIFWVLPPGWAKNLMARTRKAHLAFNEIKQYMLDMVHDRRNVDNSEQHYDLFSGLLDAEQHEVDGRGTLSEEELLGNMFIFLLAGHETTAHTLCFTFALLALYPDEQERLYEHIHGVISNLNGMPVYEAVPTIPKRAAEDTTLTTTFPVPSGTQINIHVAGLHYNPRYWKDPHKFVPDRFLGDWPRDAFIPFGLGPRACIGRRFFETEGIAVMVMLVSKYKIEIKEEPEFASETSEERYARITAFKQGLTTTPLRVPLVFKRR